MSAALSSKTRLVLLGASNVTLGFHTIVGTALRRYQRPLSIFAAMGLGRAYSMESLFLLRRLPSILDCKLWSDVGPRAGLVQGIIADVGNDLLYGAEPEIILSSLEVCLDRLQALGAAVTVTGLPVENLARLSALRFHLFLRLFFPRCPLRRAQVISRAYELDVRLRALCQARSASYVALPSEWYAADPIHFRPSRRARAWSEILGAAATRTEQDGQKGVRLMKRTAWSLAPAERWILGVSREHHQPCVALADGTSVSIY
jgi:hypothetical protein